MAELRWSRRALASLTRQDDYLRARNPQAADRVLTEIERSLALLAEYPQLGRRIEGTKLRLHITRGYRYRLICREADGVLELRDILHPRQRA